jgi:hypothetical protein
LQVILSWMMHVEVNKLMEIIFVSVRLFCMI